jgi:hypothetical protein
MFRPASAPREKGAASRGPVRRALRPCAARPSASPAWCANLLPPPGEGAPARIGVAGRRAAARGPLEPVANSWGGSDHMPGMTVTFSAPAAGHHTRGLVASRAPPHGLTLNDGDALPSVPPWPTSGRPLLGTQHALLLSRLHRSQRIRRRTGHRCRSRTLAAIVTATKVAIDTSDRLEARSPARRGAARRGVRARGWGIR